MVNLALFITTLEVGALRWLLGDRRGFVCGSRLIVETLLLSQKVETLLLSREADDRSSSRPIRYRDESGLRSSYC